MSLTYTTTLPTDGALVDAAQLATLFGNIRQKFGNIVDDDIAVGANIWGSKLAANSLPGDRIASKTIAQAQIGLLAVGNGEIIDGTIQKGKLTTTLGSRVTSAQVDEFEQSLNFNTITPGTSVVIGGTPAIPTATNDVVAVFFNFVSSVSGAIPTVERTVSGANHAVTVRCFGSGGSVSGSVTIRYRTKT